MSFRLLFYLLLLSQSLFAQQTNHLDLKADRQVISLDNHASLFVDSTSKLTLAQVSQTAFQANFFPLDTTVMESGPGMAYWLKIPVVTEDTLTGWYLLLKNSLHHKWSTVSEYLVENEVVDVWISSQNGEVQHLRTGMLVPASEKIFAENNSINAVACNIPTADTSTIFIRVQNPYATLAFLSAELRAPHLAFPVHVNMVNSQFFLSMGITGVLSLLSFFFFFFVRDKSYLFFGFFTLILTLHYTILHPANLCISWFVPEHPVLYKYFWIVLTHGSFINLAFFGRSFMSLRERHPRLDMIMLVFIGLFMLSMILAILKLYMGWTASAFPFPIFIIPLSGVLLIGLRVFFLPEPLAKLYGAGIAWFCLFSILGMLWALEIISFPANPWMVSQLGLMLIYTFGLAYKLHLNERARADARRVIELDAMKSRFFANISHEFRTPLTLIQGPLNKAVEQLPASEYEDLDDKNDLEVNLPARHVDMMRRNAGRLGQLIDQLLDLSKLENGSMQLQVVEGDIISFLRAMVFSFESLAERRQIHFQIDFPPVGQTGYFDRDKLEKIISNLLSNAFKYTPERGRVAVKVNIEQNRLKMSVEDSGPGISHEELDKIFERFYQVEGTEDKGTGIGLSLVKELVELHAGQIQVESVQGKGTTFKVSLPVGKEAYTEEEISRHIKTADTTIPEFFPGLFTSLHTDSQAQTNGQNNADTILIVEDNPDLRRFIAETMGETYHILTAENGRTGLKAALEYTPDLIISDVMMPEMNGLELGEKLKADERTSHIPLILLTAKADQQNKVEGLETGADAYLTKPFDENELRVRVRKLIEQRRNLRERYANVVVDLKNISVSSPDKGKVVSAEEKFLQKVFAAIQENISNEFFSVEDLAEAVSFSRSQLHRKLKAITGKSATSLIREIRLARAKELLEQGQGNVSEIAMEVGYNSLSYFTKSFKAAYGKTPSEV